MGLTNDGDDFYMAMKVSLQATSALKLILETKHLYQNAEVDLSPIETEISKFKASKVPFVVGQVRPTNKDRLEREYQYQCRMLLYFVLRSRNWRLRLSPLTTEFPPPDYRIRKEEIHVVLPQTIIIPCSLCSNDHSPHNPAYVGLDQAYPEIDLMSAPEVSTPPSLDVMNKIQLFILPYQCQSCKGEPLTFLIRRNGGKLQLVGRSHYDTVIVPSSIPREEAPFYSEAIIARNCNRVLVSLFYLRTLIEQYMRRVLNNHKQIRGEELADLYSGLLPEDFPSTKPSLKTIYKELSATIHGAVEDEDQFNKSLKEIGDHFALVQQFPLRETD